jgi:hypothetical protein
MQINHVIWSKQRAHGDLVGRERAPPPPPAKFWSAPWDSYPPGSVQVRTQSRSITLKMRERRKYCKLAKGVKAKMRKTGATCINFMITYFCTRLVNDCWCRREREENRTSMCLQSTTSIFACWNRRSPHTPSASKTGRTVNRINAEY